MKKGKFIDIYVIMASMSHKKKVPGNLKEITKLIEKACADCDSKINENIESELAVAQAQKETVAC